MTKVEKYIFIDTNLFHGLFISEELCKEVLQILEKLSKNDFKILLPQQVLDEINRNRFTAWLKPLGSAQLTRARDLIVGEVAELRGAKQLVDAIEREITRKKKETSKRIKRLTTSRGHSSKTISRLIGICDIIPDSDVALSATRMRVAKGNPPFETDEVKKDCDRYIWELLLEYFAKNNTKKPRLYFFTKNYKDWCIEIDEKKVFNPFLIDEFSKRFAGTMEWFDNLKFLPSTTPSEKQAVQKEVSQLDQNDTSRKVEATIADKLRYSNSWGDSDRIMDTAVPFIEKFSAKTIIEILKASRDNLKISAGPYNQVLGASRAAAFFDKLVRQSFNLNMPLSVWKEFYSELDENEQERFISIRRALEEKDTHFSIDEIKHLTSKDISF